MSGPAQRMAFGAALALAAACGGQAFTTTGDAGAGDGTIDVGGGDDSGQGSIDGPRDVTASDASSDGSGDTAGDGARDAAKEAAPAPDASGDSATTTDGPSSGGDGESDAAPPEDVFVPDAFEEPPPHCGGVFACAPGVPSGWSGPFELYTGAGPAPSCSANFVGPAYSGSNNLAAKAATCGCTCGSATGITCSTPSVSFYGQSVVGGGTCATSNYCGEVSLSPGACTYVAPPCTGLLAASVDMSAGASVPAIANASCPPVPSQTVPPVSWGTVARACLSSLPPAQVDCAAGSVCAPVPASPFITQVCISQAGSVACPATGYTAAQVFYGSVDDGRACTRCSCGVVSGAQCGATVSVSSTTNSTCGNSTISYIAPYTCDGVNSGGDFRVTTAATGGGCTASTVTATGTASPATPTTFCCLP